MTFLNRSSVALAAASLSVLGTLVHAQTPAPATTAQSDKSGTGKRLLLRDLNLTPGQKTKVDALEKTFLSEAQVIKNKIIAKYEPQERTIHFGSGTPEQKKVKAGQLKKQMMATIKAQMTTALSGLLSGMEKIITPAQKPQFDKNKAAVLADFQQQFDTM